MTLQVKDWDIILVLVLEMLNCYTKGLDMSIYAFSSGKFLNVGVYACVKKLTNIMSGLALTKVCLVLYSGAVLAARPFTHFAQMRLGTARIANALIKAMRTTN